MAAQENLKRLGELLIEEGVLLQEELEQCLIDAGQEESAVGLQLLEANSLRHSELGRVLARNYKVPEMDLEELEPDPDALKMVPEQLARKHELVPVAVFGDMLCIAKANYYNRAAIIALRKLTSKKIIKVLRTTEECVRAALDRWYKGVEPAEEEEEAAVEAEAVAPPAEPAREPLEAAVAPAVEEEPEALATEEEAIAPQAEEKPAAPALEEAPVAATTPEAPPAPPDLLLPSLPEEKAENLMAIAISRTDFKLAQRSARENLIQEWNKRFLSDTPLKAIRAG